MLYEAAPYGCMYTVAWRPNQPPATQTFTLITIPELTSWSTE